MIAPITNDEEHISALHHIEPLYGAEPGTPEGDELDRLADLINDYEDLHYPMGNTPKVPEKVLEYT